MNSGVIITDISNSKETGFLFYIYPLFHLKVLREPLIYYVAILLCVCNSSWLHAQFASDSIDFNRIPHQTVRDFLRKNQITTANNLFELSPSCLSPVENQSEQCDIQYYLIQNNIDSVWKYYSHVTANQAWNNGMVSPGLFFSRKRGEIIYQENGNQPIEVGEIVLANIRLLFGLLNIPVAFEITQIDPSSRTIGFCYLEKNITKGSQLIQLEKQNNGNTKVLHLTKYHSKFPFRDRYLYPYFHKRTIAEFHRNLAKLITSPK